MTPDEIRTSYLEFFEERGHRVVASSPVVPQGDPTLLFTNAGMNQFKDVLLGHEKRDYVRAASVQKCIRAGGKHNDLDEVGQDGRHLTFFEMLGNWSFGEYYKEQAIAWAWEYITEVLELDRDRLYVTVYKDDDASHDIWADQIGFPTARIARQGDIEEGNEENFWSMGPTGPCGPCTEIHYDLHPERGEFTFAEGAYDEERVIEFWNLVFMESNRDEDGTYEPLPMQSVDTGLGLDRMALIKAGRDNIFQTGLFEPILIKTASMLDEDIIGNLEAFYAREDFPSFAVIADHIRSVLFSLCDGAKFSNEGRGSVVRSILRRAVRHGRSLGFDGPFLHEIAQTVIERYGDVYPELEGVGQQARELIRLEEERFFATIDRGLALFEKVADQATDGGRAELTGEEVFKLHATYGFPPDLTQVMAREQDLEVDMDGYREAWAEHQRISRGKDVYAEAAGAGDWQTVHEGAAEQFVGYDHLEATTRIRRWRASEEGVLEILLAETPFYAESGGQVGDTGILRSQVDEDVLVEVFDTQKTPIGIVHRGRLASGELEGEALEGEFIARVDADRRHRTMCNHTATHLLHAALRELISDTIFQSGSAVTPDKLRFDFSWGEALGDDQIRQLEDRVNARIRAGHPVTPHVDVERDVAVEQMGAMAIFGEKYGDRVRVVEIPGESVELCGGTHVGNTRDIGLFRITSEASAASGIRRIEAVTGQVAYASFQRDRDRLGQLAATLKTDVHQVTDRAEALMRERAELERGVDQLEQKLAQVRSGEIADEAVDVDGVQVIAQVVSVSSRDQLLAFADKLREQLEQGVVLLGANLDGKAALLCLVTEPVFKQRGLKAGELINAAAEHVDGRGGGRPTLAQAGGSKPEGLGQAIEAFEQIVRDALG